MLTETIPATEMFDDDELDELIAHVSNQPPVIGSYWDLPEGVRHREFNRFISLPEALDQKARLPFNDVKMVEYDVDTDEVRIYFKE